MPPSLPLPRPWSALSSTRLSGVCSNQQSSGIPEDGALSSALPCSPSFLSMMLGRWTGSGSSPLTSPGPLAHNRTFAHCLTLMDANVFSMSRCSLACKHMLSVAACRATGRSSWPCPLDPPTRLGLLTPGYDSRCCLSCSMKSAC